MVAISAYRSTLYVMVQWNAITFGRPAPALRPHLWHSTLLRVWGIPQTSMRQAIQTLTARLHQAALLLVTPNLLQLQPPPWHGSVNFGLSDQCLNWALALQAMSRCVVGQFLLEAEWAGAIPPQAAEIIVAECREIHISWTGH